jgi:hypothetical protein
MQDCVFDRPVYKRPVAVGLSAGTQGVGVYARLRFMPHWHARLGFSYLPLNYSGAMTSFKFPNPQEIALFY